MDGHIIYYSIFAIIYFIFSLFLSIRIKARRNQLFLSLRSPNILQVTNITISLCLIIVIISEKIKTFPSVKDLLSNGYLCLQIILFISIILKYQRLIICSSINFNEDDLEHFKVFKIKDYFFQFYFMRILFVISILLLGLTILISYTKNISLVPLFFLFKQELTHPISLIIWAILFTIENSILFVYALFMFKKDLQANLKTEIFLLITIKLLYSSIIGMDLFSDNFSSSHMEKLITILYFLLLQSLTIIWPILSCRNKNITTIYSITKQAAEDLFLFLSNEKCYDRFEKYLTEDELNHQNLKALDLYIRITKFRLSCILNQGKISKLREDLRDIYENYFSNKHSLELLDDEEGDNKNTFEYVKRNINMAIKNNIYERSLLNPLLENVYYYLNKKFMDFKSSDSFTDLIYEIGYETYIRCKLSNCGLLKK
jgi:hypothetical protein